MGGLVRQFREACEATGCTAGHVEVSNLAGEDVADEDVAENIGASELSRDAGECPPLRRAGAQGDGDRQMVAGPGAEVEAALHADEDARAPYRQLIQGRVPTVDARVSRIFMATRRASQRVEWLVMFDDMW